MRKVSFNISSSSSSSSPSLIISVLILVPLFFVPIAVILLDPSPHLWFTLPFPTSPSSSPPSSGSNNGSLVESTSVNLHAAVMGTVTDSSNSSSSLEKQTTLLSEQHKGKQEHGADGGLMIKIPSMEMSTKYEELDSTEKMDFSNVEVKVEETEKDTTKSSSKNSETSHRMVNKMRKVELGLARARFGIREAAMSGNRTSPFQDQDYIPAGPIYHNPHAFHRSYMEMEKVFKVFVYPEGDPPLYHDGPCKSIYSTEGRFIYDMELGNLFKTMDPDAAHMFFLPFSVTKMVSVLYEDNTFDTSKIELTIRDYVATIAHKYPFWNRSLGADHFMLSCHDWGPDISGRVTYLSNNSVRVLCNANSSEGFNPSRDVSLPEINLKTGALSGLTGGSHPSQRPILGFFAGGLHGWIRHILLNHWKNKDQDLQIYQSLPRNLSYEYMMKNSKFCICPSGYEVASPRIVEAIYAECVPVIVSSHYVLPFSDVLDWRSFSVSVRVEDIPSLKSILMGISTKKYLSLYKRVKEVQRHFVMNSPPKKYDLFHMIMHSVWLRRLNVRLEQKPNKTGGILR